MSPRRPDSFGVRPGQGSRSAREAARQIRPAQNAFPRLQIRRVQRVQASNESNRSEENG